MRIVYISIAGLVILGACDTSGTGSIAIAGGGSGATHVAFIVQPSTAVAGAVISPSIIIDAENQSGGRDTNFRSIISVTIGGTGGGTISGTTSVAASSGRAAFGDLKISAAGSYTLIASSPPLAGATSSTFSITP